jgi:hypothetical protein
MGQLNRILSYAMRIIGSALAYGTDAFAGTKYTDVIKMGQADYVTFLIHVLSAAAGDTDITVNACDDTTPSNEVAGVPFSWRRITHPDTYGAVTHEATTMKTTQTLVATYEITVSAIDIQKKAQDAGTPIRAAAVRLKLVEDTDLPVVGYGDAILSGRTFQGTEAAQDSQV